MGMIIQYLTHLLVLEASLKPPHGELCVSHGGLFILQLHPQKHLMSDDR